LRLIYVPCTGEGTLSPNLTPRGRVRSNGVAPSARRAVYSPLSNGITSVLGNVGFNRLSIPRRLMLLVLALALPLNLVFAGVIWGLVNSADEAQRTSLLYTARSIAAGVDAEISKYRALAEPLARSPELLDDNLDAFASQARRQFPAGGDVSALVADASGQQ